MKKLRPRDSARAPRPRLKRSTAAEDEIARVEEDRPTSDTREAERERERGTETEAFRGWRRRFRFIPAPGWEPGNNQPPIDSSSIMNNLSSTRCEHKSGLIPGRVRGRTLADRRLKQAEGRRPHRRYGPDAARIPRGRGWLCHLPFSADLIGRTSTVCSWSHPIPGRRCDDLRRLEDLTNPMTAAGDAGTSRRRTIDRRDSQAGMMRRINSSQSISTTWPDEHPPLWLAVEHIKVKMPPADRLLRIRHWSIRGKNDAPQAREEALTVRWGSVEKA